MARSASNVITITDSLPAIVYDRASMKELKCPHCNSAAVHPPAEGKRKWTCETCGDKFKIKSKEAGKILRLADENGIELGRLEPFLITAILDTDKKNGKSEKKKKKEKKRDIESEQGKDMLTSPPPPTL